jgi:hypothetical protein
MLPKINLSWNAEFPVAQLRPVRTLEQMIQEANDGLPDAMANSMRLNWMVQDFKRNGMTKPIFVDSQCCVIVGDTRLMAAKLLGWNHVPVLMQSLAARPIQIHSREQLLEVCGLSSQSELLWSPQERDLFSEPVDWFEIDDPSTVGHWHDEPLRLKLIQHYVDSHPGFRFAADWYHCEIDWSALAKQLGH